MKITSDAKKSMTTGSASMVIQDINPHNTQAVISILRDKIYTDKPKAALTETVCNAIDEHRKHGVKRPVDIVITSQNIIVRDYAKGLDEHGVMRVFFQYMNSTKSDNNIDIGGYGIGAKAPSSYTDTWYVVSLHNGKKTTYMSTLDGEVGKTYKMLEQDCDKDNTGICVVIPINNERSYIRDSDSNNFRQIAYDLKNMIGCFSEEPEVECYYYDWNSTIKDHEDFFKASKEELESGKNNFVAGLPESVTIKNFINNDNIAGHNYVYKYIPKEVLIYQLTYYHGGYGRNTSSLFRSTFFGGLKFIAYDGDVCYNVKLPSKLKEKYGLSSTRCSIIFFFEKGELSISPTREEVSMSSKMEDMLERKLKLLDEALNGGLSKHFEEKYNNEKKTIYKSYNEVLDLRNIDFNSYSDSRYKLDKYPTVRDFANSSVPKLLADAVISCDVEKDTGKVTDSRALKYSSWNGWNIGRSEDVVYLVTETTQKLKAFYKSELAKATIDYRKTLNIYQKGKVNVVFISSKKTLDDHFNNYLKGNDRQLVRENIEWVHIDNIVSFVPKRVVVRTKGKIVNATQTVKKKVVTDIWDDRSYYTKEDIDGKKVLGILASDLTSSSSYWKTFKSKVIGHDYCRRDYRRLFYWLTGFDAVVKVYKEEVEYWKNAGVTMATDDVQDRINMVKAGAKNRNIVCTPPILSYFDFLNSMKLVDDITANKLNLTDGSRVKIPDLSYDMYDVSEFINMFAEGYAVQQKEAKNKLFREAFDKLSEQDSNKLVTAVEWHCVNTTARSLYVFESMNFDMTKLVFNNIKTQKEAANKEAAPVLENVIKTIDISLN